MENEYRNDAAHNHAEHHEHRERRVVEEARDVFHCVFIGQPHNIYKVADGLVGKHSWHHRQQRREGEALRGAVYAHGEGHGQQAYDEACYG